MRAFRKYWARVCKLAKIQDLHFHDLRHTFTTRLQSLGVDYEVRQTLLGHRMPGMTATYSHGGPEWDAKLAKPSVHYIRHSKWSMVWSTNARPSRWVIVTT
ncbi:tyrosine-type recombinase/integrase [Nitrospira sp. KM1]|uniref:tyrosine-type recombinase/integrase n=1 Tax=Nitrospira sp. KM1 TaxID=1936990 RepID=UPI0015648361